MKNFNFILHHFLRLSGGFLLFWVANPLSAQSTAWSGLVHDEFNEGVIGVNIIVKNTYRGTTTDLDGRFTLPQSEASVGDTLVLSYLGYDPIEIPLRSGAPPDFGTIKLKPDAAQLGEVVVLAGSFEAGDKKKVTVLNSIDVATTAGANADIGAAMNALPGTQAVGEEGLLFVRGGAANETQTFIDGMAVPNFFNSSVPGVPARGRFSPFGFSGTSFSTGGYSAEYGQALSSALMLESNGVAKKTQTNLGIKSTGIDAAHQRAWDKSSLAVSGQFTDLTPYNGIINQNVDWISPFQNYGGDLVYRHQTSQTGLLRINGSASNTNMSLWYPDPDDLDNPSRVSLNNNFGFASATIQDIIDDKWTVFAGVTANYNADETNFDNINEREEQQLFQARARISRYFGDRVNVKFGAEYRQRIYDYDVTDGDELDFQSRFNLGYTAAFAEADLTLSSRLFARIGQRFEHSSLVNDFRSGTRLSMAYKLGPFSQLAGSYGNFFQLPQAQFMAFNSNLEHERADHYMLNYQYTRDRRVFRAEAYYKTYNQLTTFEDNFRFNAESLGNEGSGYARGIDLFFRDRKTIPNVDYWISYSFLDTERRYLNFPTQTVPYFASSHNVSVVYKQWIDQFDTYLGATYTFASGRPFDNPGTEEFNDEQAQAFHNLSANLSYVTSWWGHYTIVHLSCTNLLGTEQIFGYRYGTTPNADGQFNRLPIEPTAKRFIFLGVFMTMESNKSKKK